MTLTRARAAGMVCPVMTAVWGGERYCMGDSCPMWRWSDPPSFDVSPYVAALEQLRTEGFCPECDRQNLHDDECPVGMAAYAEAHPRHGYCGLAGKPEQRL